MYNYELKKILFKYYYCIILILILNCNFLSAMRHAQEPTRPAQAAGAAAATSMYGYQHGMPLPPVLQHAAARAASHGVVGLDVDLENLSLTSATGSPTSSSSTAPVAGVKRTREMSGAATSEIVDIKRQKGGGSSNAPGPVTESETSSTTSSSSSDETHVPTLTPEQELAAAQERKRIDDLIDQKIGRGPIAFAEADMILADVRYPGLRAADFAFKYASFEVFRKLFEKLTIDEKRSTLQAILDCSILYYFQPPIPGILEKTKFLLDNGASVARLLEIFAYSIQEAEPNLNAFFREHEIKFDGYAIYLKLLDLLASYGANFSQQIRPIRITLRAGSMESSLIALLEGLRDSARNPAFRQMLEILLSRAKQLRKWQQDNGALAVRRQQIQQIIREALPAELIGLIGQYDTLHLPAPLPDPLPDQAIAAGSPLDQYFHTVSTTQAILNAAQRLYTSTSQAAHRLGRALLALAGRTSGGQ